MDKREIEEFVSARIRGAVEEAAADCVRELNAMGHDFTEFGGLPLGWRDGKTDLILAVNCALGVGLAPSADLPQLADSETEAFIALAESGTDREALVLNLLEGDIANGGFYQLYDNKGIEFIREAVQYLQGLGARSAKRIVERALELIEEKATVLSEYEKLRKELCRLDSRFGRLRESIPALFARRRRGARPS